MSRENCILILEEDSSFLRNVADQLSLRGYSVLIAGNGEDATRIAARYKPLKCVLGLKEGRENRLEILSVLLSIVSCMRIVVATEYGSVATAVAAMKHGAKDYLAKPFQFDILLAALRGEPHSCSNRASDFRPMDGHLELRRVEWEYIQRVLLECDGNITEAARRLNVHRRTLQRKLDKHPVPEVKRAVHWSSGAIQCHK